MKAWIRLVGGVFAILIFGSLSATALGAIYSMPSAGNDIVGLSYIITVRNGDSLTSIRQKHDVSYDELLEANPNIDFYKLEVGQRVIIPKRFILPKIRQGIVVNVPELRLYYFTPDG